MLYNYDKFIHFRQTICQVPCYSSSSDSIRCTYIHYGSGIHTSPSTVAQCFIFRLHQYPHTQGFPLRNGLHIYNRNVSIIVCVFCSFTRIKGENIMSMVMTTVMTTEMTMVLLGRRIWRWLRSVKRTMTSDMTMITNVSIIVCVFCSFTRMKRKI